MSIAPRRVNHGKRCFLPCPPERCNCGVSVINAQWEIIKAKRQTVKPDPMQAAREVVESERKRDA